jgi:hypothetical protein
MENRLWVLLQFHLMDRSLPWTAWLSVNPLQHQRLDHTDATEAQLPLSYDHIPRPAAAGAITPIRVPIQVTPAQPLCYSPLMFHHFPPMLCPGTRSEPHNHVHSHRLHWVKGLSVPATSILTASSQAPWRIFQNPTTSSSHNHTLTPASNPASRSECLTRTTLYPCNDSPLVIIIGLCVVSITIY